MSAKELVLKMQAAAQQQVEDLSAIAAELDKDVQAPVVDDADGKLQAQIDELVKERDALRTAIQSEIDDKKQDTARLEAAIAPVEVAPTPVVPAPVEAPAPEQPAAPAPVADEPAAQDPAPVVDAPAQPAQDPAPAPVITDGVAPLI